MVKLENDCCGCAVPAYPCVGDSCPNRQVPHYYCDECGWEADGSDSIYYFDGQELCIECIKEKLEVVT